jgi:hypothetical protein
MTPKGPRSSRLLHTLTTGLSCLLPVCLPLSLHAADWPAISDDVWAMKEDPAKGHVGAVFLEERLSFRGNHIEHLLRVRILSESGRSAAELPELVPEAYAFEGRTVQRNGTVVPFDNRADMEKRTIKAGGLRDERTVMVPPGVTSDCVVEVKWRESSQESFGPLPASYGYYAEWVLANRFPTLLASVDFPDSYEWPFIINDPKGQKGEVARNGRQRTYRDLPPIDDIPFSLGTFHDVPRVLVFWLPSLLANYQREKPQDFWRLTPALWAKEAFKVKTGGDYAALSRKLIEGLPPEPIERAFQLMMLLDARIRNDSARTFEEDAKRSEKASSDRTDPNDLNTAARNGWTSARGMFLLYYSLARDAGLDPTIALVANRDRRFFRPGIYSYSQFDDLLLVVRDQAGKQIWIDPTLRFATPGIIWAGYQGSTALELLPGTWEAREASVPVQSAESNVVYNVFAIDIGEDGDNFTATGTATGHSEWQERRKYRALEQKEQDRVLKEHFGRAVTGATIESASVSHAHESGRNLTWSVKGSVPQEEGRRRIINPFPGLTESLDIPATLPEKRTVPIVLPLLRVHVAQSTIRLPAGYRFLPAPPVVKSNTFGKVTWSAEPKTADPGSEVVVSMRVELLRIAAPAEAYEELKAFLAWIREAASRTVALERES